MTGPSPTFGVVKTPCGDCLTFKGRLGGVCTMNCSNRDLMDPQPPTPYETLRDALGLIAMGRLDNGRPLNAREAQEIARRTLVAVNEKWPEKKQARAKLFARVSEETTP